MYCISSCTKMSGFVKLLQTCRPIRRSWQFRLSSSSAAAPPTQGVPYTKLTVGVPKEIWNDEKRYLYFFNIIINNIFS